MQVLAFSFVVSLFLFSWVGHTHGASPCSVELLPTNNLTGAIDDACGLASEVSVFLNPGIYSGLNEPRVYSSFRLIGLGDEPSGVTVYCDGELYPVLDTSVLSFENLVFNGAHHGIALPLIRVVNGDANFTNVDVTSVYGVFVDLLSVELLITDFSATNITADTEMYQANAVGGGFRGSPRPGLSCNGGLVVGSLVVYTLSSVSFSDMHTEESGVIFYCSPCDGSFENVVATDIQSGGAIVVDTTKSSPFTNFTIVQPYKYCHSANSFFSIYVGAGDAVDFSRLSVTVGGEMTSSVTFCPSMSSVFTVIEVMAAGGYSVGQVTLTDSSIHCEGCGVIAVQSPPIISIARVTFVGGTRLLTYQWLISDMVIAIDDVDASDIQEGIFLDIPNADKVEVVLTGLVMHDSINVHRFFAPSAHIFCVNCLINNSTTTMDALSFSLINTSCVDNWSFSPDWAYIFGDSVEFTSSEDDESVVDGCLFADSTIEEDLYRVGASPKVYVNNTVVQNFTTWVPSSGAVFATHGASMTFSDSVFLDSVAAVKGEAMSFVHLLQCQFVGNAFGSRLTQGLMEDCLVAHNVGSKGMAATGAFTAINSTFVGNRVDKGGAFFGEAAATIVDCVFLNNSADIGGALWIDGGSLVANSSLLGNIANLDAGAIYIFDLVGAAQTVLSGLSLRFNSADSGGAVQTFALDVLIEGSTCSRNSALNGGCLVVENAGNGLVVVREVDFVNNVASSNGGALQALAQVRVANSSFIANTALGVGGALQSFSITAQVNLTSVVVSNNVAVAGSAAHVLLGAALSARQCTITSNTGDAVVGLVGDSIALEATDISFNRGSAINVLATSVDVRDVLVMGNNAGGFAAIEISTTDTAFLSHVYVLTNIGKGINALSSEIATDLGSAWASVAVCGNTLANVVCTASSMLDSDVDLCVFPFAASCLSQCQGRNVCVDLSFFAGPYGGCHACNGECEAGFVCPIDSECEDVNSPVGNYTFSAYCECEPGYEVSGSIFSLTCEDENECLTSPCAVGATCTNTNGSFTCACQPGYTVTLVEGQPTCTDINECLWAVSPCAANLKCVNMDGTYACECSSGFYGTPLPPNYDNTACTPCPTDSRTSGGNSTTLDDCQCIARRFRSNETDYSLPCLRCPAGSAAPFGQGCEPCPLGFYSDAEDSTSCTECWKWSTTLGEGSTSSDACVCQANFTDGPLCPGGLRCSCVFACPEGSRSVDNAHCEPCKPNTYTPVPNLGACIDCPVYSSSNVTGSTSVTDCMCMENFELTPNGRNFFCNQVCPPGTRVASVVSCADCPANTFSSGFNSATCTNCPGGSVSPPRSNSVDACVCGPGFELDPTQGICLMTCQKGSYRVSSDVCLKCAVDKYADEVNMASCLDCPLNAFTSGEGAVSRSNCTCGPSYALDDTTGECVKACAAGTFLPTPTSECAVCGPNTYSDSVNAPACTPCPLNTVTRNTSSSSAATTSAPPALHSSVAVCECIEGLSRPLDWPLDSRCPLVCGPGTYLPTIETNACFSCPVNTYAPFSNVSGTCFSCPSFSTTLGATGASSIFACSCSKGFYAQVAVSGSLDDVDNDNDNDNDDGDDQGGGGGGGQEDSDGGDGSGDGSGGGGSLVCVACPEGATCAGGLEPPSPNDGYTMVDGVIYECDPPQACLAGGSCADGYEGELCARCSVDYYRLDGRCQRCRAAAGLIVFLLVLLLFLFCVSLTVLNLQDRLVNKFASAIIALNSLQIMAMYGRIDLNWPRAAEVFFEVLSFANFNIELLSPECAVTAASPFTLRWVLTLLLPLFMVFMFMVVFLLFAALSKSGLAARPPFSRLFPTLSEVSLSQLAHTCQRSFYQILVIAYLPLCAAVFEFFACAPNGPGTLVVATSPDMACYTPSYNRLIVLAVFAVLAYPVGIPLGYLALLRWKVTSLGMTKFNLRYSFLVGRFRGELYFFEAAIMARKVSVVICMTFLSTNTTVQALGAVMVVTFATMVHLYALPYHTIVYNTMETICLLCSIFVLVLSMMLQGVSTTSLGKSLVIVFVILVNVVMILIGVGMDIRRLATEEREVDEVAQVAEETLTEMSAVELNVLSGSSNAHPARPGGFYSSSAGLVSESGSGGSSATAATKSVESLDKLKTYGDDSGSLLTVAPHHSGDDEALATIVPPPPPEDVTRATGLFTLPLPPLGVLPNVVDVSSLPPPPPSLLDSSGTATLLTLPGPER